MVEQLLADIMNAIMEAKRKNASREMNLVITKLEEALLWYGVHQRKERESAGQ